MNFDGSFVRSLQKGRIGGVIRDWNGNIVRRSYSEPIAPFDANEAELFAILIGYQELLPISGYNAIF